MSKTFPLSRGYVDAFVAQEFVKFGQEGITPRMWRDAGRQIMERQADEPVVKSANCLPLMEFVHNGLLDYPYGGEYGQFCFPRKQAAA